MKASAEDRLLRELLKLVPISSKQPLGPGDDCAALHPPGKNQLLLLKTDCIAEDVHFLRSHDPARVAWKALCRPLSDIAAMGGTPGEALITFFSPPDVGSDYWLKFYRGLGRAARKFGVTIAGGEMSRQNHGIAVSVALTGSIEKKKPPAPLGWKTRGCDFCHRCPRRHTGESSFGFYPTPRRGAMACKKRPTQRDDGPERWSGNRPPAPGSSERLWI